MKVVIIDDKNLAPEGFAPELSKCIPFLPFKLDEEIPVHVEEQNPKRDGLAWNCAKYTDEGITPMAVTLSARDIDANVKYNRMNYWLFITLHQLAYIYFRRQRPEIAFEQLIFKTKTIDDECRVIAHDTLRIYKNKL